MTKFHYFLIILTTLFFNSPVLATKPAAGMVVTSQHLASKVGQHILMQGGNAIDAAVAVGYALSVVEPCCGNLGGGGLMVIHLKNHQNIVINFREKAPLKAHTSLYLDSKGHPVASRTRSGYLAVAVPGTVMGLNTALEKYGTMPLQQLIQPAIVLAQQGFILQPSEARLIQDNWQELKLNNQATVIFSKQGHPLTAGDRLVQKDLAQSLQKIAKGGTAAFYQGDIAKQIINASQHQGGVLSTADFLNYTVQLKKPLRCHYRGYDIISAPPPSSGGVTLCEMLGITEGYPLTALGYRSPQGTHDILEAMRFAYIDRNRYLGDPDFVNNPIETLLSRQHIANIRHLIQPSKATSSHTIATSYPTLAEKPQTTHYSIVDKDGNAVAVTYTLNGYFGSKVIAGNTGFFLNNQMDDFSLAPNTPNKFQLIQGPANAIAPQKRPLSSITPTIVLKNKQLFMVLGAPGGSTIPTQVLETLENVIDYHLPLQQAIDAPRYHLQALPDVVFMEPHAFSPTTLKALKTMGYHFQMGSPYHTPYWGAIAAIMRNTTTGQWIGAIDKRRPQGLALSAP